MKISRINGMYVLDDNGTYADLLDQEVRYMNRKHVIKVPGVSDCSQCSLLGSRFCNTLNCKSVVPSENFIMMEVPK